MAKVLATSDWHLDWATAGLPRYDDIDEAIDDMLDEHLPEIDLFLFLGDLTDPDSARAWRAVDRAADHARRISDQNVPSIWLAGNHDHLNDGYGTTTLDCLARARVKAPIHVIKAGRVLTEAGIEIMLLPHPGKGVVYDPAEYVLKSSCKPSIIAAHLTLQGYDRGSESEDMPRGKDVLFPIHEIETMNMNAVLLCGHHHKRGALNQSGAQVHVPGSLARLTFNEEHNAPGYLLLEV